MVPQLVFRHTGRSMHRTRRDGCTYGRNSVQRTHRRRQRDNLLRFAFGEMFGEVVDGSCVRPILEKNWLLLRTRTLRGDGAVESVHHGGWVSASWQ